MSALVEAVFPSRLGRSFRWLVSSSWTSNIGDGIALAAGPLLVASQTDSAFLVALAAMLQRLPWLLLGLWAPAHLPTASTGGSSSSSPTRSAHW